MSAQLQFDQVSLSHRTDHGPLAVLRDVSLTVAKGEFVAIIGPSGCGKTSLLRLAAGLATPSAGRVTLDGLAIAGPGPDRGVVFQDYGVFPWLTVEQNIAFGLTLAASPVAPAERAEIVDHYLDQMGLRDFRAAWPKTLSGGMKQRVALARAYAVQPKILLMDEPFAALDAQTRLSMQDLLLRSLTAEPLGGLLITHAVEEALYLAAKVVAITARPGRVNAVIDVPFPYPRTHEHLASPEFARLKGELTELVMREHAAHSRRAA